MLTLPDYTLDLLSACRTILSGVHNWAGPREVERVRLIEEIDVTLAPYADLIRKTEPPG